MKDVVNNGKHKILIVDDQIGIVSFLHEFFTNKGYEVLEATNGKKAVQIVEKESPPFVLLDVNLGWGVDGIQVLKEIKEIAPDTQVIMMTGVSDEEIIEEAIKFGAVDYITKPFSLKYLEKIVMLKVLHLAIKDLGDGGKED